MHDLAPVLAGPRADVDHVVGYPDRLLVVLDDQDGVAEVPQPHERLDEALVVALVEPDGGLIEDVQDPDQAAADLGGEPDALGLAARQAPGVAVQREVVEADVEEEAHPGLDLLEDRLGDHPVPFGQLEGPDHLGRLRQGQRAQLVDVATIDGHPEGQRQQAGPVAHRAVHLTHVALDLLTRRVGLGLGVPALQVGDGAFVAGVVAAGAAVAVLVPDVHPLVAGAGEQQLAVLVRQLPPRGIDRDVVVLGHGFDEALEVLAVAARPRGDGAVGQAEVGVGHDQLGVDLELGAEAVTGRAGAVRGVEREVAGGQLAVRGAAGGARQVLAEGQDLPFLVPEARAVAGDQLDLRRAVGELQGRLQRVGQAALDAVAEHQPVDDDLDGVHLVAGQLGALGGQLGQLADLAVEADAGEALRGQVGEQGVVGALAAPHHGGQHLEPGPLGQIEDPVDDLLGRLAVDDGPVLRAVRDTDAGVQQPEVVVDLGDRPDGGAGVARGALLVDRDGR